MEKLTSVSVNYSNSKFSVNVEASSTVADLTRIVAEKLNLKETDISLFSPEGIDLVGKMTSSISSLGIKSVVAKRKYHRAHPSFSLSPQST